MMGGPAWTHLPLGPPIMVLNRLPDPQAWVTPACSADVDEVRRISDRWCRSRSLNEFGKDNGAAVDAVVSGGEYRSVVAVGIEDGSVLNWITVEVAQQQDAVGMDPEILDDAKRLPAFHDHDEINGMGLFPADNTGGMGTQVGAPFLGHTQGPFVGRSPGSEESALQDLALNAPVPEGAVQHRGGVGTSADVTVAEHHDALNRS